MSGTLQILPFWFLAGKDDPIVPPPNGQVLAGLMPHCRHILLDGGHLIWEDAAEAYSTQLGEWLTSTARYRRHHSQSSWKYVISPEAHERLR
jgi:pimeloyl-ACP methyl ester carboxylesterase